MVDEPRKKGAFARAHRYVTREVWWAELTGGSRVKAFFVRSFRVAVLAVQGFFRDRVMMQSGYLTYVTVLSLVPLLAFSASIVKGFGLYGDFKQQTIVPWLDDTFGELPPVVEEGDTASVAPVDVPVEAPEDAPVDADAGTVAAAEGNAQLRQAFDEILGFIDNTDIKGLGVFGLAFLLYAVLKLLSSVERSMNDIWGVKRARTLPRKVADYVGIVVVAPIFLFTATGMTAWLQTVQFDSIVGDFTFDPKPVVSLLPFLSVGLGMSFVYLTMPNTRVTLWSGILGGVFAGVAWQGLQFAHIEFQVGVAKYDAIFAGFAAFPIFLVWLYLSWVILLAGAELACAHQNEPVYVSLRRTGTVDQSYREALALRLVGRATRAFLDGDVPPESMDLATELGVSPRTTSEVLDELVDAAVLARTADDDGEGFLPARDPATLRVSHVLAALRNDPESESLPIRGPLDERADEILAGFVASERASEFDVTLAELAQAREGPELAREAPAAPRPSESA